MNRGTFGTFAFAVGMAALVLAGSSVTELPPEATLKDFVLLGLAAGLGCITAAIGINLMGFNDDVQ